MQNVTSNLVYVVALGQNPLDWSSITLKETVVEHNYYYHLVGGKRGGWPRMPPNYVGFRFDGRLQQIRHIGMPLLREHGPRFRDQAVPSRRSWPPRSKLAFPSTSEASWSQGDHR